VSRLDDVIARHEARKKMTSRKATVIVVGAVIVMTIVLELFTNLGTPKAPPPGPPPPPPPPVTHVDDVKLMRPPAAHTK
jgi:predicted Zn-dependent peptidase